MLEVFYAWQIVKVLSHCSCLDCIKKSGKFLKWQQKNMEMKLKNEHIATNISSEIIYKWKYGELYIFFQL